VEYEAVNAVARKKMKRINLFAGLKRSISKIKSLE